MKSPDLNFKPRGIYIGGKWETPAEDKSFVTINPSNMEKLADVPFATEADVDRTVKAAKAGFKEWSRVSIKERARCLVLLAERIEKHADELALMDAVDSGNAITGMRGDMTWTADSLRFFAGMITEIKGETFSQGPRHLNFTRRQPYGVVVKINPFNHPFRFCAEKAAAPLAAGNCVVIKGSEQAPLSSLRLGELCDGIFPPGVVNIVTGDGKTGSALVRHPDVHRIGLVGSVATGKAIAREAADGLKRCSFELGGKNPIIIFPDADPKKAAAAALKGMNMNRQGQSCSSTSRVFVHKSLHKTVVDELVKQAEALPIGVPWLKENDVGPIVSQRQHDRIMGYIDSAKSEGAKLLTGGGKPADKSLHDGLFIAPTVFDDVKMTMKVAREEIFGPVMSVIPFTSADEVIELSNDNEYGLAAAVWTRDIKKGLNTAKALRAGIVWINDSQPAPTETPWGGYKQSGIGRELGREGLDDYLEAKHIYVNLAD